MTPRFLGILLATALLLTGCASLGPVTTLELQSAEEDGVYKVSGAVLHSGTFNLPPGEFITLGQAIRRAGGPKPANSWDDGADLSAVRLERLVHGSVVEYTLIAYPGGHDEDFHVKPGNFIKVPKCPYSTPISNPLPYAS